MTTEQLMTALSEPETADIVIEKTISRHDESQQAPRAPYDDLFRKYFEGEWRLAKAVCQAESGLRADAVSPTNRNGTRDHGLCQINDSNARLAEGGNLLDPEVNVRVAARLRYQSQSGWNNWTVYKTGKYKQFL